LDRDLGELTMLGQPLRLKVTVKNTGRNRLDAAVRLAAVGAAFSTDR
jgi:hypothetical protein